MTNNSEIQINHNPHTCGKQSMRNPERHSPDILLFVCAVAHSCKLKVRAVSIEPCSEHYFGRIRRNGGGGGSWGSSFISMHADDPQCPALALISQTLHDGC